MRSGVVIAASRLPYRAMLDDDARAPWGPAVEGLLGGLLPVARDLDAVWVGGTRRTVVPDLGVRLLPVLLTEAELGDERDGFSGATVWPLYHDVGVVGAFAPDAWRHYVAVNQKVAHAVAAVAASGAVAWIHGYQLQLVPRMLRKLRADLSIGFFLHVPFPPPDLFRQLPWRRQLLLGLLGADVIGVPARSATHNIIRCVREQLGRGGGASHVTAPDGRRVRIRCYPAAVDVAALTDLAIAPQTARRMAEMRTALGGPRRVLLGIDRLDHTTGLPQRIRALTELYDEGALDPADTTFVQVVTPVQERTERSRPLAEEVDRMIGHVNSRYGHLGHPPVAYLSRHFPRHEVVALYRLADVMVATPLRGGMGLVAKEYVVCRVADDGALVLSEFTAAADELPSALVVNPYDVDAIKAALLTALDEPPKVRSARMHALRDRVRSQDVHTWAQHFLDDLASA